jgi:hypothetical protein
MPSATDRTFDAGVLPLASGQIVVSETGDATSLFFSLFTENYAPWVHAGILAIEDGVAFVYDATGTLFPIPGVPPTSTVGGSVRRVALTRFVRGKRVVGFYAPGAGIDAVKLVAFARGHYARGTPFDAYFDADDSSALYCTEFVALGLQAAGAPAIQGSPMRANASLATTRNWLRIRARRLILAGQLLESAREVVIWSPDLERTQIEAYFAAKRELHRRFGAAARLGHLFRWTGFTLALRDEVRRFVDASLAAGAGHADDDESRIVVQRTVAALAQRYFSSTHTGEATLTPSAAP